MFGKLSAEDVKYVINTTGLSSRSVIRVNEHGIPIVSIQLPLSLYGGVKIPYGVGRSITLVRNNVRRVVWKGDDNGSDQLTFIGANVIISVGKGIVLPEEHNSDEHYPLIHQVNNGENAERIHYACISGSKFSLVSIVETFSCMSSLAITELLQRGPGHEIIHANDRKTYADLLPHPSKASPWRTRGHLPFPLRDVGGGWISRPIPQEG